MPQLTAPSSVLFVPPVHFAVRNHSRNSSQHSQNLPHAHFQNSVFRRLNIFRLLTVCTSGVTFHLKIPLRLHLPCSHALAE